jgi:hypothetical protein
MTDFDNWVKTGGFSIDKNADIKKDIKCKKEIEKLVEDYGWEMEKPILSLLNSVILVKTDIPATDKQNMRCIPEIKEFKGKLESILKEKCDLEIEEFYDKAVSNDLQNRRIDIKLKRRN